MSAPTREECLRRARAALEVARAQNAADYAAGLMSPERRAVYERLLRMQQSRQTAAVAA
jgi:phosphoribosylcarboxyaminoimidazole (NCAIR) mutase